MAQHPSGSVPFVSVITINWNGQRFLEKLLPLLQAQTYPHDRYEIIVLDNDSTRDDSVSYIKKNFPHIRLIENSRNDGFARGCNLAITKGNGDYFLLINNDTMPHMDWLEKIVNCAVEEDPVGAVVSKVLFAHRGKSGTIINNAGSTLRPDKSWPIEEIGANELDGPTYSKRREISAVSGTSLLLSRPMLEQIGLFDESFFMYFEDGDLSWRGQKAGWKFIYCPDSVVLHEHSGSSKEHSDFWTFYVTRNRLLIVWKHARLTLALKVYLSICKQFILIPILLGLRGKQRRHQLHQLKLGLKIIASFWRHVPTILLKRFGILPERQLR